MNKVFDTGTVGFKFALDSKYSRFSYKLFSIQDYHISILISLGEIEVIAHQGKKKEAIFKTELKPKFKPYEWN